MTNNSSESNKNSDSAYNNNMTTDTPRKGDYQCQAGILQGDRCKNDATLETRGGYKCCVDHAPLRDSETLRDDVKAITSSEKTTLVSDTPRTDSIDFGWGIHEDEIWDLTRQLERELSDSKAEVKKLQTESWFTEAAMTKEIATLDEERRELSRQLHLHERGMYHKPKMQATIDTLRLQLARAVEIAEMFSQVKGLHHQCNCAMCQKLAELKSEIK